MGVQKESKKNKGFTLIELLAVIVILAVIALIAVPQIMKIIYQARLSAAKDSAYGIIDTAENYVADKILLNGNEAFSDSLEFVCNKENCSYEEDILKYKGSKAKSGKVIIGNNGTKIALEKLLINGFTCNKDFNEDIVYCEEEKNEVVEIVDKNKGIICGDGTEEDYDNVSECYIKSIEDYKEFYTLVNSGKSFSGKTVYLMKNLDLKDEVDIEPIGNSSNPFSGTFIGKAYTLSNMNIKGSSYVGMFGYVKGGKIEGLTAENINIEATGNYVGGMIGYLYSGTINEISLSGNIESTGDYVGGIVGRNYSSSNKITSILVNANVTGRDEVGGVYGYFSSNTPTISAVVESGTIIATSGRGGKVGFYTSGTSFSSSLVILSASSVSNNGNNYVKEENILSMYDDALDTYIGGDNDSSGYYFDYDSSGKVVLLSIERNPMTFNLTGEGTKENPYIINNEAEWKQATTKLNKYYKLNNDLDFKTNRFYSLGTNSNPFSGNLQGNAYYIKNVTIEGYSEVGLIGYMSSGKVEGINVENINIHSTGGYVGGIVGYLYSGTINEISLSGNIESTGEKYVGGIVGRNYSSSNKITSILVNANVTGIDYVGGVYGYYSSNTPTIGAVVESGTITAINGKAGKISPYSYSGTAYASSSVVLLASTANDNGNNYFKEENILSMYDDALDTYIGGDNDSSGCYFDYDASGKVVLFSIERNPMTFTLKGEGTEESPYIINNEAEWKQATTKLNKYYKLSNDLDFKTNRFYSLGTNSNPFSGNLQGNAYYIKNVTIEGYSEVGLIGYMSSGKVEGINVENINIHSTGGYVGGIVGYLYSGTINEISLSGNIESTGEKYVGGIVGRNYSSSNKITSILVNANVTGIDYVGGVYGYYSSNTPTIGAVVESGTITAINGKAGKISPYSYSGIAYASSSVVLLASTANDNGNNYFKEENILSMYDDALDTYIGGDNDSSGCYFDYDASGKVVLFSIERNPMAFTLKGEGTEESPYIINNETEWKQATTKLNKYYKLNNDLDFKTNRFYSLGTYTNPFSGNLQGNAHDIKNVTIEGHNYVGLIGYMSSGKVEGLNIENINIHATGNNIGGIVGYLYSGTLNEISLSGNIESTGYDVGGIVGYIEKGSSKITSVLVNAKVTGRYKVGGVFGDSLGYPTLAAIIESEFITATSGSGGKISADSRSGTAYASSSVVLLSSSIGNNGTSYDASYIGNLSYYETLKNGSNYIIETVNTGDYNNSGYIFGYKNINGVNKIQVIKVG